MRRACDSLQELEPKFVMTVGIPDVANFSLLFKKRFGMSCMLRSHPTGTLPFAKDVSKAFPRRRILSMDNPVVRRSTTTPTITREFSQMAITFICVSWGLLRFPTTRELRSDSKPNGVTRLRSTPAAGLFLLRSNRSYTQPRSLVVDHMQGGEYSDF